MIADPVEENKQLVGLLRQILLGRIAEDRLVLPAMPAVALKCLALLRDPDFSIRQAAALLERDPILAAQLLRAANSALLAATGSVKSIEQAATRLGSQKLRLILIEASARQVFESRDRRIAEAFRVIWEHSVGVAMLARDVAALSRSKDPDSAYLAGLLHDVGKPIVGAMLLEAERMLSGRTSTIGHTAWLEAVHDNHRVVGIALATKWNLSDAIGNCIRDCVEYDAADRMNTANFVRFANAVTKREGIYLGAFDSDEVEAQIMLGRSLLDIDEDILARLCKGLRERVRAQAS